MKYSRQRDLILKTLQENAVHPTADTLYAMIKEIDPAVSLATVYRNLNLLANKGLIRRIRGLDGSAHFDHNTHNHYHFICSKCNKVYDMPYDIIPELADKAAERTGLLIDSYDISFRGICPECKKLN